MIKRKLISLKSSVQSKRKGQKRQRLKFKAAFFCTRSKNIGRRIDTVNNYITLYSLNLI